jgi:hypothetical protein
MALSEDTCQQLALSNDDQQAVRLAVEEACVNVVNHGYKGVAPGLLSLEFRLPDAHTLQALIGDQAVPFYPDEAPTPDLLAETGYRYTLNWCHDDQPLRMRTRGGEEFWSVPYPQELNDIPMIVGRKIGGDAFADMIVDAFARAGIEEGEINSDKYARARFHFNLMMIESRPAPRASFEYIFYADCAGHRTDEHFVAAIHRLRSLALETTVLGSYPLADSQ